MQICGHLWIILASIFEFFSASIFGSNFCGRLSDRAMDFRVTVSGRVCGQCRLALRDHDGTTAGTSEINPMSFAGVLATSTSSHAAALQKFKTFASTEGVSGATSYCSLCRRITWLGVEGVTPDQKLVQFYANYIQGASHQSNQQVYRNANCFS